MLRAIRERRDISQTALAKKVGVHRVTVARIESGSRQPSMDLLQRLAKALKVPLSKLLT